MEQDIGIIEKNKTFETSQRALIWSILQYGKFYFSAFIWQNNENVIEQKKRLRSKKVHDIIISLQKEHEKGEE